MTELFQSKYESFKIVNVEGFNDDGYVNDSLIATNVPAQTRDLNNMVNDYSSLTNIINTNYEILNNKYIDFNQPTNKANIKLVDDYESNSIVRTGMLPKVDPNSPSYSKQQKKIIQDARNEDAEIYILQQNYLYILGTITFAIVTVGAIVIARN
jgi:hypothetical protein